MQSEQVGWTSSSLHVILFKYCIQIQSFKYVALLSDFIIDLRILDSIAWKGASGGRDMDVQYHVNVKLYPVACFGVPDKGSIKYPLHIWLPMSERGRLIMNANEWYQRSYSQCWIDDGEGGESQPVSRNSPTVLNCSIQDIKRLCNPSSRWHIYKIEDA